jgi:hypothetical protein
VTGFVHRKKTVTIIATTGNPRVFDEEKDGEKKEKANGEIHEPPMASWPSRC